MMLIEEKTFHKLCQCADPELRKETQMFSAFVPDNAKWVKEYCVWKLGGTKK